MLLIRSASEWILVVGANCRVFFSMYLTAVQKLHLICMAVGRPLGSPHGHMGHVLPRFRPLPCE